MEVMLSAIYGRTPNLHLVVAAELSAFKVNAGPYGLVDPMPVICEMRDVRLSWSTILLSPTSWDSRSGIRSCIGQLKFCPIPEFVVTILAFMSLVQVNTESVMNRLQIVEQKTAHINTSVKEGRRLSLKPEPQSNSDAPETVSNETLDAAHFQLDAELDAAHFQASNETESLKGSPSQPVTLFVVAAGCDDLSSLLQQFDQRRRDLASITSSVVLLKSSAVPLTLKQQLLLKRDEKALMDLQISCDAIQTHLFDRVRALDAEKNRALTAAEHYRTELRKMQAARDNELQLQATSRPVSSHDASIRDPSLSSSQSSASNEPQQML